MRPKSLLLFVTLLLVCLSTKSFAQCPAGATVPSVNVCSPTNNSTVGEPLAGEQILTVFTAPAEQGPGPGGGGLSEAVTVTVVPNTAPVVSQAFTFNCRFAR